VGSRLSAGLSGIASRWLAGHVGRAQEAIMKGYGESPRDDSRWVARGTAAIVVPGRRQVRVRKVSGRKLRDLPELDLRTPSGRRLPF
jgi:membrane protein implicated in regulation of membrane protease activity